MILPYKLVAIDLDGTLLNGETHAISVANAQMVMRASDVGMTIVLASGRRWATIDAFSREIGLPPQSPIIAYNGAMIRTHAGDTWFHQPLPADASQTIVAFCAAHGCHLNYYLNDELYVRTDTPWARLYQKRTGSVPHVTGDLSRFDGEQPTKLLLIDTPEATERLLVRFQAEFGDTLYVTKTEDEYLEFMDPRVNKGVALAETARRLGLSAQDCVAFGDSYNDLPMLEWAGLAIAMENGRTELKALADRIAPPADDDGVATILSQFLPVHPQHK